jgi:hypothetical protein
MRLGYSDSARTEIAIKGAEGKAPHLSGQNPATAA